MRERNIDWLPLACVPTGDESPTPGMCPDQELNQGSNWGPFASQDDAQPTEPCWPGQIIHFFKKDIQIQTSLKLK